MSGDACHVDVSRPYPSPPAVDGDSENEVRSSKRVCRKQGGSALAESSAFDDEPDYLQQCSLEGVSTL